MRCLAMSLACVIAVASCAGDPAAGLVFACDPDWQAAGAADPCRAGCRCERAPEGWGHAGVCACGSEGFDFGPGGGDATDDVPGPDEGDVPPPPDAVDAMVDAADGGDTTDDPGAGELPDVCMPDCKGMNCGQDGCGGSCGECEGNQTCQSGSCRPSCWPAGPCPGGYQEYDGCRCRVVPTGAKKCMTDLGLVECDTIPFGEAYYGQDAHLTFEEHAFWTLGDGVVSDQNTGLVWNGSIHSEGSFEDAALACASDPSEGSSAWRLPNYLEFLSMIDFGVACPTWHPLFGAACEGGMAFWSSSTVDDDNDLGTPDLPLVVDFGYGFLHSSRYDVGNKARCVRGNEVLVPVDLGRFSHDVSTVIDRLTGLEWQAQAEYGTSDWQSALAACNALGVGWHLPTVMELASLLPISQGACPSWGGIPIPGGQCKNLPTVFWTSTPMPDQESSVFTIDFGTASIAGTLITNTSRATRCVRFNG